MRAFNESHPWITFQATDINPLTPKLWMLLGEARSKCEHLAGAPLRPDVARQLYEVTLIKGAQATTAIEGNTLSEEQVAGIRQGTFHAPPSRAYQAREVANVLDALTTIDKAIMGGEIPTLSPELIAELNQQVLQGTALEADAIAGTLRTHSVTVGSYRGAPGEDVAFLLDRLATWLESDTFSSDDPELRFALTVACATYAHLYLAWIHPFGDGNGRTARLVEYLILARCATVPFPAAHLLSNHYNLTRDQYYRELHQASQSGSTTSFLGYATQGLIDGIREQIERVRTEQFHVTWINHVHETMARFPSSPTRDRQRSLVLAMPSGEFMAKGELPGLSPKLAAGYARAGPRTLSRDLNRLRDVGLVVKRSGKWLSNDVIINAFLPPTAANDPTP